jgi:hypothetical protein
VLVTELGSWPLTIQFLCFEEANDIKFWIFGTEYQVSWKDLSRHLNFSSRCAISLKKACSGFTRDAFWGDISGRVGDDKIVPQCNDILHPTLHLWHKWLAITLIPREDVRPVCVEELMILYATINKINVSPLMWWFGNGLWILRWWVLLSVCLWLLVLLGDLGF